MPDTYSLDKQTNFLRQALSDDKRPLGVFLGAGCPVAVKDGSNPLIPDIAGLTAQLDTVFAKDKDLAAPYNSLKAICAEDIGKDPNLEHLLSYARSMLVVAGKGDVRGLASGTLQKIEDLICDTVVDAVNKPLPTCDTPFHCLAQWIAAAQRAYPIEIFTTNYDLLIEQALEDTRVPYFDGFVGARQAFFDPHTMERDVLPLRWARLWKLHGSISWHKGDKGRVYRTFSEKPTECSLIHPSHLKYDESRRMPYFAMADRLSNFLAQPHAVLATLGFSFRDQHLNSVIIEGLQANPTAAVFALLRGKADRYPEAIELGKTVPSFSLLMADKALIGAKMYDWAPPAVPGTPAGFTLGDFEEFGTFLRDIAGSAL